MIPRSVAAALDALRFSEARELRDLAPAEWDEMLAFCDRMGLTLLLDGELPDGVRRRIKRDREKNRERVRRLTEAFREIAAGLAGIDFLVLKGFANWGEYTPDPAARAQYDLDLYCPGAAGAARDALRPLGYEPAAPPRRFPTDHLPPLVRKTSWQWTGDYYDPDIPLSLELHFRLWDERTEGFAAPGVEAFWERRVVRAIAGVPYQALDPADALAYAALHLLRHLLRGDVRVAHAWEIAYFLELHAGDGAFWREWRERHGEELRRLQAIVFRLAQDWFGCRMHEAAREEIAGLPRQIERWFERCARSPLEANFGPNKDELALHLCLLEGFRVKARVLRRRLLPGLPGRWSDAFGRGLFHARALAPAVSTILRMRR